MKHIAHRLAHAHPSLIVGVFAFWLMQLVAWVSMMAYVQLINPTLGQNVLYVTQISHWALVITCGTAATATWGVITSRTHHAQAAQALNDLTAIEAAIARLAALQPGPEAQQLAARIRASLTPENA